MAVNPWARESLQCLSETGQWPGDHESLSITFTERTSQYFSSSFTVFSYQHLNVHSPHLCLLNKVHPSRPNTITSSSGKTAFLASSALCPSKIILSFSVSTKLLCMWCNMTQSLTVGCFGELVEDFIQFSLWVPRRVPVLTQYISNVCRLNKLKNKYISK